MEICTQPKVWVGGSASQIWQAWMKTCMILAYIDSIATPVLLALLSADPCEIRTFHLRGVPAERVQDFTKPAIERYRLPCYTCPDLRAMVSSVSSLS